ncbi:transposon Tf2-9 polyprotein, partial [Trichonephila clavipes]
FPFNLRNEFRRQIADLEKAGIISKSNSQYNTPALFVKQKEKWRLVLDFWKLNEITLTQDFVIPTLDDILHEISGSNYFSALDMKRYIKNFAKRALPLTNLLRKDIPFEWTSETQEAFDDIKKAILNPPVLALPDPNAELQITTDASSRGIGAVLEQKYPNSKQTWEVLNPVGATNIPCSVDASATSSGRHTHMITELSSCDGTVLFRNCRSLQEEGHLPSSRTGCRLLWRCCHTYDHRTLFL